MHMEGYRGKHSQNSPEEVIKEAHALPDIRAYNKAIVIKEVYSVGTGTDR